MQAAATSLRFGSRKAVFVAAGVGVVVAATLLLWARYGVAAFYEMAVNGLGLCF